MPMQSIVRYKVLTLQLFLNTGKDLTLMYIIGSRHTPVYYTIVELVVLANAVSFFGNEVAKDEQFMKSALAYIEETLICAEIVRLVPKAFAP
jgi:hypothetical protein